MPPLSDKQFKKVKSLINPLELKLSGSQINLAIRPLAKRTTFRSGIRRPMSATSVLIGYQDHIVNRRRKSSPRWSRPQSADTHSSSRLSSLMMRKNKLAAKFDSSLTIDDSTNDEHIELYDEDDDDLDYQVSGGALFSDLGATYTVSSSKLLHNLVGESSASSSMDDILITTPPPTEQGKQTTVTVPTKTSNNNNKTSLSYRNYNIEKQVHKTAGKEFSVVGKQSLGKQSSIVDPVFPNTSNITERKTESVPDLTVSRNNNYNPIDTGLPGKSTTVRNVDSGSAGKSSMSTLTRTYPVSSEKLLYSTGMESLSSTKSSSCTRLDLVSSGKSFLFNKDDSISKHLSHTDEANLMVYPSEKSLYNTKTDFGLTKKEMFPGNNQITSGKSLFGESFFESSGKSSSMIANLQPGLVSKPPIPPSTTPDLKLSKPNYESIHSKITFGGETSYNNDTKEMVDIDDDEIINIKFQRWFPDSVITNNNFDKFNIDSDSSICESPNLSENNIGDVCIETENNKHEGNNAYDTSDRALSDIVEINNSLSLLKAKSNIKQKLNDNNEALVKNQRSNCITAVSNSNKIKSDKYINSKRKDSNSSLLLKTNTTGANKKLIQAKYPTIRKQQSLDNISTTSTSVSSSDINSNSNTKQQTSKKIYKNNRNTDDEIYKNNNKHKNTKSSTKDCNSDSIITNPYSMKSLNSYESHLVASLLNSDDNLANKCDSFLFNGRKNYNESTNENNYNDSVGFNDIDNYDVLYQKYNDESQIMTTIQEPATPSIVITDTTVAIELNNNDNTKVYNDDTMNNNESNFNEICHSVSDLTNNCDNNNGNDSKEFDVKTDTKLLKHHNNGNNDAKSMIVSIPKNKNDISNNTVNKKDAVLVCLENNNDNTCNLPQNNYNNDILSHLYPNDSNSMNDNNDNGMSGRYASSSLLGIDNHTYYDKSNCTTKLIETRLAVSSACVIQKTTIQTNSPPMSNSCLNSSATVNIENDDNRIKGDYYDRIRNIDNNVINKSCDTTESISKENSTPSWSSVSKFTVELPEKDVVNNSDKIPSGIYNNNKGNSSNNVNNISLSSTYYDIVNILKVLEQEEQTNNNFLKPDPQLNQMQLTNKIANDRNLYAGNDNSIALPVVIHKDVGSINTINSTAKVSSDPFLLNETVSALSHTNSKNIDADIINKITESNIWDTGADINRGKIRLAILSYLDESDRKCDNALSIKTDSHLHIKSNNNDNIGNESSTDVKVKQSLLQSKTVRNNKNQSSGNSSARSNSSDEYDFNFVSGFSMAQLLSMSAPELAKHVMSLTTKLQQMIVEHRVEQEQLKNIKDSFENYKKDTKTAVQRHQSFIDQLIKEKQQLTDQCSSIIKEMETKHLSTTKSLEEKHKIEIKKACDKTAASEKIKRDKWVDMKTKKIKELTIKGLEPELNRMAVVHQEEIAELRRLHQRQVEEAEGACSRRIAAIKLQANSEKEQALLQEREAARGRLEHEIIELEKSYKEQRRRLLAELAAEREQINKENNMSIAEKESQLQKKLEKMISDNNEKLHEQEKNYQSELERMKNVFEAEKEAWMSKQKIELNNKERLFKEDCKRERDRHIDLAIRKLETEATNQQKLSENKLRNEKDNYDREMKEIENVQGELKQKLKESRAETIRVEENNAQLNSQLNQTFAECNGLKQKLEIVMLEQSDMKHRLEEAARQQVDSLKRELAQTRYNLCEQISTVKNEKERELQQVYNRIKETITKKDDTIILIEKQRDAALEQCNQLENMLQQHRQQFIEMNITSRNKK